MGLVWAKAKLDLDKRHQDIARGGSFIYVPPPLPKTPYANAIRARSFIGWSVGFTTETIWVQGEGWF